MIYILTVSDTDDTAMFVMFISYNSTSSVLFLINVHLFYLMHLNVYRLITDFMIPRNKHPRLDNQTFNIR